MQPGLLRLRSGKGEILVNGTAQKFQEVRSLANVTTAFLQVVYEVSNPEFIGYSVDRMIINFIKGTQKTVPDDLGAALIAL